MKPYIIFLTVFLVVLGLGVLTWSPAQINNGGGGGGGTTCGSPTCTVSTSGGGNGVLALSGNTSGTATLTAPAVAGTATNPISISNVLSLPAGSSNNPAMGVSGATGIFFISGTGTGFSIGGTESGEIDAANFFSKVPYCTFAGNSCLTEVAGLLSATGSDSPLIHSTNNTKAVGTSDFTSANASGLQAITGLSYPLNVVAAQVFTFHCALMYSQATNVAGDQFGVGVITTAPTNVAASGEVWQNTTAGTSVPGTLPTLSTTTPTAVVTFQPAVTSVLRATLDGTIETAGAGAATFNVYVLNGTAADVIVVKRGSTCTIY